MSFAPCVLIPIFNHWRTIRATVERLSVHALPIFIVDDGSDAATQRVLAELVAENASIRLFRLPQNSGKGAAVMRGMREAQAAGFSHALQIDADGQHDARDVPKFLAHGETNPHALVCGKPIFDESIPRSRLYGRYLTHFWVCVETLNPTIIDSMCGFRLYPLAATCNLIGRVTIPTRMNFDTEIFVRLTWQGLKSVNIETRVVYPEGGLSHFDMLRDNLRISLMHTGLCCGMLLRLPLLLWRKLFPPEHSGGHWSKLAERGCVLGLKTLFACYRLLGERAAQWLLYPIVAYFFLTGKKARLASRSYLRRIHERNGLPAPGWRDSFRHMLAFGRSGLDKLAAWSGDVKGRRIAFPDRDELVRRIASGRGAVLLGAHLGNLEMTRALAHSEQKAVVNAVVYTEHAQRFNDLLKKANADFGVNLIQVSRFGPDTSILLKEKIDNGELVVIVGDRTPPAENSNGRVSQVEFLGEPAPFAQGPFILAALLDCPVYLIFCLREKHNYRIYLEPFAERIDLPRRDRLTHLQAYMQRYAKRLEQYCLQAPEQWFNFYDFWQATASLSSDKA